MTGLPVPDVIDDLSRADGLAVTGTRWEPVTDTVMGGRSAAVIRREPVRGHRMRPAGRGSGQR
ncbi:MAG: hypothetical protein INF92_17835 [Rhodobacter sp.]|nr:hypothetical protein [Rhodobacter sp.]